MNIYWAGCGVFVIYMISAFALTSLTKLTGSDLWLLRGALASLGISSYGIFYWWISQRQAKKQAAASQTAGGGAAPKEAEGDVDILFREAETRLAASKLAQETRIANLPVFLVMGDAGSVKTTTMVHSGIEPELLAGHIYHENNVVPTRAANFWFARQAMFIEAGGGLSSDSARWNKLIRRLQPGRLSAVFGQKKANAPRAVILCFDCEHLTRPGDALTVMARNLHARLGEISQTLGVNLPVYVLFTRTDRIPFFAEWVRTFNNDEARQVFGATLPMRASGAGVYDEEESRRLSYAFNELYYSLCDKRIELLPREHDPEKLPAAYEFAREFRKIRDTMVQFLVDLCRPSQLRSNPFLRGFYFSGVRAIFVTEQTSLPATPSLPQKPGAASGATGIFQVGAPSQPAGPQSVAQPQATVTRKTPQWVFLGHLFSDVILQDRLAMGASGASSRTSTMRRALLAAAAALCLLFSIGFTVSFINNRSLQGEAMAAAQAVQADQAREAGLPSLETLTRLERLRAMLNRLTVYEREGAPFFYRWFLYAGSEMYPPVRRIYYNRFHQAMFGETQKGLLAFLQRLPATPGPSDEYSPAYFALRAYLITTSEYKRSTLDFTSPYLRNRWLAGREIDAQRDDLSRRQWDFYATDLPIANPYSTENDAIAIDRARRYLAQFSGLERIYQFMLAEASKANPAVNFNRMFAGSAEVVINNRDVQGAFTKKGWAWMMDALKKADQFLPGERWVLGDYAGPPIDRAKLEQELTARYTSDFIAAWRQYLKNSVVVRYGSLRDAANKLNKTSSNQSPLLALFWLASNNTNVDSQKVKDAFDAVHKVVPPSDAMQFIGPSNTNYMNALVTLQAGLDQAASVPGGPDPASAAATMSQASSAKIATRQVAQTFRLDPEANVHGTVQKLMEDPITHAEALLRGVGPGELNAKAKALCAGFTIVNKFPFNPTAVPEATLQELAMIFRPREGTLWQFYEANLKNFLQKQGNQYVPAPNAPFPLNPAFVRFFNQAMAFSEALYPEGAAEPRYSYSMRALPSDQLQSVTLTIDKQTTTFTAQTPPQRYVWPSYQLKLGVRVAGGSEFGLHDWQGLWSAFRFFVDADQLTQSGSGYVLTFQPTQGRSATPMMVLGRPLVYRFQLDTGGAPAIFSKDFLASLRCISQAAR